MPLHFERNDGQADASLRFLARGSGYAMSFTADGAALASAAGQVALRFENAAAAEVEGVGELPGRSTYFIGNDPSKWRSGVPHFAKVRYRGIYAGIDAVFYGNPRQLEYDLVVAPGADPARIRLAFNSAEPARVTPEGDLALSGEGGEVRQHKPVIYQEISGERRMVGGSYVLLGENRVGFQVDPYDRALPLVIDPVLSYSTYLGGSGDETARAIAVDAAGNSYITGRTTSTNFRTASAYSSSNKGGVDIFVAKINPSGTALVYSTYIGGASLDSAYGIAVDAAGNAYVAGQTTSTDLPLVRPLQSVVKGTDAFVLKLNATGNALLYSTYLGSSSLDLAYAIAVDSAGSAYVTGVAGSASTGPATDFPLKDPIQGTPGSTQDAFVSKLSPDGSSLVYSTLLGGGGGDLGFGIAVDASGSAYVTGVTGSNAFPTANPLQRTRGAGFDAFVSKLSANGRSLVYSTFLGASGDDEGNAIAVDSAGNAYVTGTTNGSDFPVVNAWQKQKGGASGSDDAFVLKLNPSGSALLYSTFLGGSSSDAAGGIAVDSAGNAYVTGTTDSADFPSNAAMQPPRGQDAYLAQFSPSGALLFASTFGGSAHEAGEAIALDGQGNVYVAGLTDSTDLPVAGAIQSAYGGAATAAYGDAFIVKVAMGGGNVEPAPGALSVLCAPSFTAGAVAPDSIVAAFGQGLADAIIVPPPAQYPETLGGTSVKVVDSAGAERGAQIYFVSPGQVNFVAPPGAAPGNARVDIVRNGQTVASGTTRIEAVAPGLFTANSTGRGPAAAVWLKVAADGAQSSGVIFQCSSAGACSNVPIDLGGAGDQVFLMLFGTGLRGRSSPSAVTATIGGVAAEVLGAVPQGEFPGFDQANLRIPRSLIGRGEVDVALVVDGKPANVVTARIGGTVAPAVPKITSVSPSTGAQGQTIASFTVSGQDLAGVNAIEFAPSDGVTVTAVRATATSVTAQVAIGPNAATGTRNVTVVASAGRSNALPFTVTAAQAPPPVNDYMPVETGRSWSYRVTFPETVRLPYQPIIEDPAGVICASTFCGTRQVTAGTIDFSMTVNASLGVINGGESFRLTVTEPAGDFYFARTGDPMEMRMRTVQGSPQLELIDTASIFRLVRPLARPTASELAQTQSLIVAAGAFQDVVKTTVTLTGNGTNVAGTYTTDVYLARGVGLIKAVMRDSSGKTLFTQELTAYTAPSTGGYVISNLRAGPSVNQSDGVSLPITVDFSDPSGNAIDNDGYVSVVFNINNGNVIGFTSVKPEGAAVGDKSGTMKLTLFISRISLRTAETVPIKISLQGRGKESNQLTGTFQSQ